MIKHLLMLEDYIVKWLRNFFLKKGEQNPIWIAAFIVISFICGLLVFRIAVFGLEFLFLLLSIMFIVDGLTEMDKDSSWKEYLLWGATFLALFLLTRFLF